MLTPSAVDIQGETGNLNTSLTGSYLTGVVGGTDYTFEVLAHNKIGWSAASPVATIKAATLPAAMAAPTVALDGSDVKITWVSTVTLNHGTRSAYKVVIKDSGGTYQEDAVNCGADSVSNPVNYGQLWCKIPMLRFGLTPYSLVVPNQILAKVQT